MPVTNECPFRLFRPYLSKDTTLRPAKHYQKFSKLNAQSLYFPHERLYAFITNIGPPSIIRDLRLPKHLILCTPETPAFLLQILSLVSTMMLPVVCEAVPMESTMSTVEVLAPATLPAGR
jgi:hypothetical protein